MYLSSENDFKMIYIYKEQGLEGLINLLVAMNQSCMLIVYSANNDCIHKQEDIFCVSSYKNVDFIHAKNVYDRANFHLFSNILPNTLTNTT